MSDLDDLADAVGGTSRHSAPAPRVVYVQAPKARRRSGCFGTLLAGSFAAIGLWVLVGKVMHPTPPTPSEVATPTEQESIRAELHDAVQKGAIDSYDADAHEVRVDPVLWGQLDLEHKQGLVIHFSVLFEKLGHGSRVEIKSNHNDTVLGEQSAWSGVQIHQ